MSILKDSSVDIVLQGGMGSGFFCAGFLRCVAEGMQEGWLRLRILRIIANSTPTLFSAMFLAGRTDMYAEVVESLQPGDIYKFRSTPWREVLYEHLRHPSNLWPPFISYFFKQRSLFSNEPLKRTIRKHLASDAVLRVVNSRTNLVISTMDDRCLFDQERHVKIWETHGAYLQQHPQELYKVLAATTALPVSFPNEEIAQGYYSDGVLVNCPVHLLPQGDADAALVVGINFNGDPVADLSHANWLEHHDKKQSALVNENTRRMLGQFCDTNNTMRVWEEVKRHIGKEHEEVFRNAEEEFHWGRRRFIETYFITNPEPLAEPVINKFSNAQLKVLFDSGYLATLRMLWDLGLVPETAAREKLRLFY